MILLRSTPKIIKSVSKITEGEKQNDKGKTKKRRHHSGITSSMGRDNIDMTAEASSIRSRDKA